MSDPDIPRAAPAVSDEDVDALLEVLPRLGPDQDVAAWFDRAAERLAGDGDAAGRAAVEVVQLAASRRDAPAAPAGPFHDVEGRVTVCMSGDGTLVEVQVQAGPYALNEMVGRRYLLVTRGDSPLRVPVCFDEHGEGSCFLPDTASVRRALQHFRLVELDGGAGVR